MEKILKLELWGILFIVILGIILHFTFDWSGKNFFVALFSAVNESVWEHLKLAVMPAIFWMLIEMKFLREKPSNFLFAKTKGIYLMPFLIIVFFYSTKAILGKDYLFLDILIFILAVILGQLFSYKLMFWRELPKIFNKIALIFLIILLFSFFIFTFFPFRIFLFQDPIFLEYGIIK